MKTPAARQKEFGAFLNLIVRFGIERQRAANPVLFRNLTEREVRRHDAGDRREGHRASRPRRSPR
jgi:hypothetical protein